MLPDQVAGGIELLVADRLADRTAQPLGASFGRDRECAMAASGNRRHQVVGEAVGAE